MFCLPKTAWPPDFKDVFIQDCYGGADPNHRLPVRIVTEMAWHSLFARKVGS